MTFHLGGGCCGLKAGPQSSLCKVSVQALWLRKMTHTHHTKNSHGFRKTRSSVEDRAALVRSLLNQTLQLEQSLTLGVDTQTYSAEGVGGTPL